MSTAVNAKIDDLVKNHKVLVFMKGNKLMPQCGFSNTVVQILNNLGVSYETVDVLSDPAIRQGIKEYSSWPTIPQVYINGEFLGGCDIMVELYQKGELQEKLEVALAS
jgi:monothiol glutaredoxin